MPGFDASGTRFDAQRPAASPESFQAFFAEARSEIEPLMREVGVTSEPEIRFWRKLESHDEVGWDA